MRIKSNLQLNLGNWFQRLNQFELSLCYRINQLGSNDNVRNFFRVISRLGDGLFWYTLIVCLAFISFDSHLSELLFVVFSGLSCTFFYWYLKNRLVRQRPFMRNHNIVAYTKPLDEYSLPSGHTMNAVNFAIVLNFFFPATIVITLPFTILIALSRVILGVHYPTDVMVGALLGSCTAVITIAIYGLI